MRLPPFRRLDGAIRLDHHHGVVVHDRERIRILSVYLGTLLDEFGRAGIVDEWALTVSGLGVGGRFAPVSARCEDEFVFTRFIRQGD